MHATVALVLGGTSLLACGSPDETTPVDPNVATTARTKVIANTKGDATRGAVIFGNYCKTCHGDAAIIGSPSRPIRAYASAGPEVCAKKVLLGGGGMSSFSSLSDAQIADVCQYLVAPKQ
jgi:mono/diheme cytochrome c family protein